MPLIYRTMEEAHGFPQVGSSRNQLGVRVAVDVHPEADGTITPDGKHGVSEGRSVGSTAHFAAGPYALGSMARRHPRRRTNCRLITATQSKESCFARAGRGAERVSANRSDGAPRRNGHGSF